MPLSTFRQSPAAHSSSKRESHWQLHWVLQVEKKEIKCHDYILTFLILPKYKATRGPWTAMPALIKVIVTTIIFTCKKNI